MNLFTKIDGDYAPGVFNGRALSNLLEEEKVFAASEIIFSGTKEQIVAIINALFQKEEREEVIVDLLYRIIPSNEDRSCFVVYIQKNPYDVGGFIVIGAKSAEQLEKVLNENKEFIDALKKTCETKEGIVYIRDVFYTKGELTVDKKSVKKSSLLPIYNELYPDIDIEKLIKSYFINKESILLLYGLPGTGKTTFIKYMMTYLDEVYHYYVKDPNVLRNHQFWANISANDYDDNNKKRLLILDDLDSELEPRISGADNSIISSLLTFGDGLFSSNESKVIITTNMKVKAIDSALVRPGRCFDFIELHPLEPDHARNVWEDTLQLPTSVFDARFTGCKHITQAELMAEANKITKETTKKYYRDTSKWDKPLSMKLGEMGIAVR